MQILKMVHNIDHDHLLFLQNKKNLKIYNFLVCQRGQLQKYTYADFFLNCKQNARALNILVLYFLQTWDDLVSKSKTFR